jgi:hypothetical protein
MEPEELLGCISFVQAAAAALVQQQQQQQAGAGRTCCLAKALQVMHAAACCFMFGFVPPLRPSVLLSLQVPSYTGPCKWKGCQDSMCRGNRLEWVHLGPSSSNPVVVQQQQLRLVAPHHKNSTRPRAEAITYTVPEELACLLRFTLQVGRRVVCGSTLQQQQHPWLFCQPGGKQMQPTQLASTWTSTVLPPGITMPPQRARSAFVTLYRSVEGGEQQLGQQQQQQQQQAVAAAMGNSVGVWDTVYDRLVGQRHVQAAINSLKGWREQVLASSQSKGHHTLALVGASLQAAAAAKQLAVAAVAAHTTPAANLNKPAWQPWSCSSGSSSSISSSTWSGSSATTEPEPGSYCESGFDSDVDMIECSSSEEEVEV